MISQLSFLEITICLRDGRRRQRRLGNGKVDDGKRKRDRARREGMDGNLWGLEEGGAGEKEERIGYRPAELGWIKPGRFTRKTR